MKFKRFLSLFFVVLLAVCIPCAFLAGCNGNSGDDGTDGNTSNNDSNGDKTYTGDAIFTEGMTLAQLRAATENIYNFTVEYQFGGTESEANSTNLGEQNQKLIAIIMVKQYSNLTIMITMNTRIV